MVTNLELLNSVGALQKLISVNIPVKKAYKLRIFIQEANETLKAFHELNDDLIKKYGKENGDGKYIVEGESFKKYREEISQIEEEKIDIELPEISIDDIDENSKIDTDTIIKLSYLIK